jgi:L-amino acid N-acyltransferase YncA
MLIRLAAREDVPAIVALSNWAAVNTPANFALEPESETMWAATWEATREQHPWLVAVDGEGDGGDARVIGFAKSGPHRTRGAYAWTAEVSVYVDAAAHRRGIGAALYERFLPTLRAQGYVTLLAGITPPNPASVRLHEKFGFVRCGTYHRAGWKFGSWHDVGYWEMHLTPPDEPPQPVRSVAEVWRS